MPIRNKQLKDQLIRLQQIPAEVKSNFAKHYMVCEPFGELVSLTILHEGIKYKSMDIQPK
ncbi:hypothetical protein QGM71_17510 [Virgibacillus sp. C22-A2]|uniref:Uncharacterized protein n=1 Tax=Virgibacillus tibetensis TaxID=3042313 RepID=A0ABU6KLG8_9BACI|nr:hypothetical protein [Virgibacillus sp. C22-A2]